MIKPFSIRKKKIKFYRLNEDLTIDINFLLSIISKYKGNCVVVVMNFFGASPVNKVVCLIKKQYPDTVIIEDFTHLLFNVNDLSCADIHIASIRKWIGIPDGAIFFDYMNRFTIRPIETQDHKFVEKRIKALKNKSIFYYTNNLQNKLISRSIFDGCESVLDKYGKYYLMSSHSMKYLKSYDCSDLIEKRKFNFFHLYNLIIKNTALRIPINCNHFSSFYVPFSFPLTVNNRDVVQERLAKKGLFASVLWPISKEAMNTCKNSAYMSTHMLSIPIDQRYNAFDIEEIAEIINGIIS